MVEGFVRDDEARSCEKMADAAADESILADQNGRHIGRCILSEREDLLKVDDFMVHDCMASDDVQSRPPAPAKGACRRGALPSSNRLWGLGPSREVALR